jgi:outer membrane protein OmpA-like peptidoglycan-associated protein
VYTKKDLVNVFMEIYRSLRNYYLVTYTPPKFAGLHRVALTLQLPTTDTLVSHGEYNQSDIDIINQNTSFQKRIPFDYNQATLKPEAQGTIDELVDFNQRLSEARAQAVVTALIQHGIDAKRLKPRGMGMLYPLVPNDTEENRALNRRTEFRILRR